MAVTCCIRYVLDPYKRAAFEDYARRWKTIIPKCGGDLVGYFMPHEGTNNVAIALVSFDSLAAYETYRARLKADDEGTANFMARYYQILTQDKLDYVSALRKTRLEAMSGKIGKAGDPSVWAAFVLFEG